MRIGIILAAVVALSACQPPAGGEGETPAAEGAAETQAAAPSAVGPDPALQKPAAVAVSGREAEPNNSLLETNVITLNTAIEAALAEGDAKDVFKMTHTGAVRDKVKFRIDNGSTTLRPNVTIYNGERSRIFNFYDGTEGANAEAVITLDAQADYFIEVSGSGSIGAYQLSVQAQNAFDRFEPNDDALSAKPVSFGEAIEANILDKDDGDWYKISGGQAAQVALRFENLSTTLSPYVLAYNRNRQQIANESSGNRGSSLDVTFKTTPGEDFYLVVRSYGTEGAYRLTMAPAAP